ncbi:Hypothetical predicted protein, partial [Pelobates cultripes]
ITSHPHPEAKMAASDRAPGPPTDQPLPAQQASEFPHEDRIVAAFNLFWTPWWAILAQTQATTG